MPDYYIRTADNSGSRGPLDEDKLLTLAEAGQIDANTLYFDEDKEEWIPIALNETLNAAVFPQAKKLTLKRKTSTQEAPIDDDEPEGIDIEEMLAAAEGDTEETKHQVAEQKSKDRAASIASSGIGLIVIATALVFILPHLEVAEKRIAAGAYTSLLNFPFLIVGLLDLMLGALLLLAVTAVYPLVRARAMIGFGFGLYLGWTLRDPWLLSAWLLSTGGLFAATLVSRLYLMLSALTAGAIGTGYLIYMVLTGEFSGFFETIEWSLINQ